jgi:TPP-dependent pyruvate/acetoin dehydrogenase alpha subunit
MKLEVERLESLYTTMVKIRRFDEKTAELFLEGLVKGTAHSYVGEEAVAAAACANLREDDYIVGTHRGHGHCIAKGARVDRMMAELFGRVDGYCRGLGGSMHIAALDLNILGCNGIVAAGLPIGNGAALAARLRHTDRVVIAFFGDGASSQGVVHESLNLAAVWKLPIIFLCENNQYALSTSSKRTIAGESIAARAAGYAIPGVRVDGNDVLATYAVTQAALQRARDGQGPTFVEAYTYRMGAHTTTDDPTRYRLSDDVESWKLKDPIARVEAYLKRKGLADADFFAGIEGEAKELGATLREGCKAMPDPTPLSLFDHVYADMPDELEEQRAGFAAYLDSFEGAHS